MKSAGKAVGTVETNALKGLVVLHKLASGTLDELVRIEPKEGTSFVVLEMGVSCPIGEKVPIGGKLFLEDSEDAFLIHKAIYLVEEGPLGTLTALNQAATIDGRAEVSLTGAHEGIFWGGDPA